MSIRANTDIRGMFIQGTTGTLFLRLTDFDGNAQNPESITLEITNSNGDSIISGIPEKAGPGFYAFEWQVTTEDPAGNYTAIWTYTFDGEETTEEQTIVVAADGNDTVLYSGRLVEIRAALSAMLPFQATPVYREPAEESRDRQTYRFNFPRWNQSAGVKIYRNDKIVNSDLTVNYFNGTVTFDRALTVYDRIEAGYNFRWYDDEKLDRFLSNATHLYNIYPPSTRFSIRNLTTANERWIPLILYGAAIDAIRTLMLSLQMQEPQLVFGGPERADKMFSNLEAIKKNYEETWSKALAEKKNGPYVGLTRFVLGTEFNLPAGRARWYRYLFSNGI